MPIAIAYTPELADPLLLANAPGGAFSVVVPSEGKLLTLAPGNNFDIDEELWQRAQDLPAVSDMLSSRLLEVIDLSLQGEKVTETPAAGVASIANVEKRAALRLIAHSREEKQLQTWHDADERIEIRNACKRRLADLQEGKG